MSYSQQCFKEITKEFKRLDKFYARSPNIYCKYQRVIIKYHFVLKHFQIIMTCQPLKEKIKHILSHIQELKENLSLSKLSLSLKHRFSKKLTYLLKGYQRQIDIIKKNGLVVSSFIYQSYLESSFIKKISKIFTILECLNVNIDKSFQKQGTEIANIYYLLNQIFKLLLNNPKFYNLISISIERINVVKKDLYSLHPKIRKRLKSILTTYSKNIQRWKWSRYYYLWFLTQIRVLPENQKMVSEFLLPQIGL